MIRIDSHIMHSLQKGRVDHANEEIVAIIFHCGKNMLQFILKWGNRILKSMPYNVALLVV